MRRKWRPRVGDWVEVRSPDEIIASLDERGDRDGMPFMPEMLDYVGHRFQISAVAHKTCDTVNRTGGRRVRAAVHLDDLRCSGAAHGGCQAACLLFWKTRWLRPVEGPGESPSPRAADSHSAETFQKLLGNAVLSAEVPVVYRCQATTLPDWSAPLRWWNPLQYISDVRSGNVTLGRALSTLLLAALHQLKQLPIAYRLTHWAYEKVHRWLRHSGSPYIQPRIAGKGPTPCERLDLKPGELVEIRPLEDINVTVNETYRNRGLFIGPDDARHCGRRARVARKVTRIINERNGQMMEFKNPCIVLDGVNCEGDYAEGRLLCPRRINIYWREIWLKRCEDQIGRRSCSVDEPPHSHADL